MQLLVPVMTPAPGERSQRFVGDRIRFELKDREGRAPAKGWRAFLRTNLGRAGLMRREILQAHTHGLALAGASWRDVPMTAADEGWRIELPLAEVGYFKAKAYLLDPRGWQHWPDGPDAGVAVHPCRYRTANTIYCAFVRLFGPQPKTAEDPQLAQLDASGYSVLPPSGKLRDLQQELPHILGKLGCRILHLLPVHPTPTTYARFGQFGSPYAALDLMAIDPALAQFDQRTTAIEQFCELTYETHRLGGRVFLDIVINHTGWGSVLQERHPEWFVRRPDGLFASPGAQCGADWITWADLVELKHGNIALWDEMSQVFLAWCRRGVDGFRCDAGYKIPVPAWQYIVARVQEEYPETIFLLEGLGGSWEATEALLTEGGMQWAYSELFQNYSGLQVAGYLDHSHKQSRRVGLFVHYSETHDNDRLAAKGRGWSLLRNRLCALASVSGGFGFTCGVEWLADEKIRVHGRTTLLWDNPENLVPELTALNRLLAEHPCFFDGASLTRLSGADGPVYALLRVSEEGQDAALVLVNTDLDKTNTLALDEHAVAATRGKPEARRPAPDAKARASAPVSGAWVDLLGQTPPTVAFEGQRLRVSLTPGAAYCLASTSTPRGLHGEDYRCARAQAAWALAALNQALPGHDVAGSDWRRLAEAVSRAPAEFLGRVSELDGQPLAALTANNSQPLAGYPRVVTWTLLDRNRVTPVPPGHWLLLQDTVPFRATLTSDGARGTENVESIRVRDGHVASFEPRTSAGDADLTLERYAESDQRLEAAIRFLGPEPAVGRAPCASDLVLLTNGRGGMARLCVDIGRVLSKYDCVLGANLHPTLPVDRHVLIKRIRVWVSADGFISPLDFANLARVEAGPPAVWDFVANAGDGRTVEIELTASMVSGRNTTVFQFRRPSATQATGKQLPEQADVRLTVRLDLEDRNFHWETKRNGGAEHHFSTNLHPLPAGSQAGFAFTPAADRQLRIFVDSGEYHPSPEWSQDIPHPVEQSRGQTGSGDGFSPGWFELPLPKGKTVTLVATADPANPAPDELQAALRAAPAVDAFGARLRNAARAFVVQRDNGKTVVAGYPWFLDWGRDSFICARGLLAAGMAEDVKQLALTFARFEKNGTLPNTIFGEDASNRDTSDAPLWFGVVCEELEDITGPVTALRTVLQSIARHYAGGTPNGIRMDPATALVWSPSHFTWMDTNYPAATPREGYPVEIQALWIRLLRQVARFGEGTERKRAEDLAAQALASLERLFWREAEGYYADVLLARAGQTAAEATADDALRSNCLFPISLGLVTGPRAQRCVEAVRRYLVVPGALRSLAPLPTGVPHPVCGNDGRLLNAPKAPYWGRYEGDEDTRRKPAYHNGTAWTWTFPVFCEALARAWDFAPPARAAARHYLGSMDRLLAEGCLDQLPEIVDGDAPHTQRGCDAQAWGVTEALRVWQLLQG